MAKMNKAQIAKVREALEQFVDQITYHTDLNLLISGGASLYDYVENVIAENPEIVKWVGKEVFRNALWRVGESYLSMYSMGWAIAQERYHLPA